MYDANGQRTGRSAAVDKGDAVLARFIDTALYTGTRLSEVAQEPRNSLEDINGAG